MNKYIQNWLDVIEYMNNDNTYKLAWGRAIIEIANSLNSIEDNNVIHFQMIAHKMIEYYWNQTFFFNLKQSANSKKPPILMQQVHILIDKYKTISLSSSPIWFDKAEIILNKDKDFYNKILTKCTKKLKDDVSWRFLIVNKQSLPLYTVNKDQLLISLTKEQVLLLKEYSFVLSQLLNYKWAQLLEKYNNAPRIASKVKGISDKTIKRNNLLKYKNILLESSHYQPIDFYTGDVLDENNISDYYGVADQLLRLMQTTNSDNIDQLIPMRLINIYTCIY